MCAVIKSGATTDQWTVDPTSKAGRVTLYDSAGHAVSAIVGLDGIYQIPSTMTQNVFASTKNSSTAQINTGGYWEGTSETTLGVAGIQINTFLNQTHRVAIYQSMDGTNWDISDAWDEPASYGTARTIQATASYYKVRVTNLSGSNATTVRIQTALCPTVEALPRALTPGGNLRVSVAADWQSTRRTTGLYMASSFRTVGDTNATQNILTIHNPAASLVNIAVRGMNIMSDSTAALTTVAQQARLSRATGLPTGGTALVSAKYQTTFPTPNAIVLGHANADGTLGTAITATAGTTIWQQYLDRPHTVVGWFAHQNYNMIPDVGADLRQIILVPGECLLVQTVTAIPATTHIIVNCSYLEYTAV
jgi:hypothetical protein